MSTELSDRNAVQPEAVQQERWLRPACDVYENENEWLISADVPGVVDSALTLHLHGTELVIEGRRGEEGSSYAGYRRLFTLPHGIDANKASAELRDGVAWVHLPKSDSLKPRRIAIKTA